ncbi:MAG: hypothetical protein J0M02_01335 [Planctomycetes bacterium]|nr:hypothetical protein [Planctomycetota bacterium]
MPVPSPSAEAWRSWSWAILPGFPKPVDGPAVDALRHSIHRDGVLVPILIDADGIVWDGRRRHLVCLEFGIEPPSRIIGDGPVAAWASLVRREMSVLERADLLESLRRENRENFSRFSGERESERFAAWLQASFGWTSGFSWKYLDGYRRIATAPSQIRERIAMLNPDNLHQALCLLHGHRHGGGGVEVVDVDRAEHLHLIDLGSQFLDAVHACPDLTQASASMLRLVGRAVKKVLLRHGDPRYGVCTQSPAVSSLSNNPSPPTPTVIP